MLTNTRQKYAKIDRNATRAGYEVWGICDARLCRYVSLSAVLLPPQVTRIHSREAALFCVLSAPFFDVSGRSCAFIHLGDS